MLGPHLLRQPHWQETLRLRMGKCWWCLPAIHSSIFSMSLQARFVSMQNPDISYRLTVLEKRRPNSSDAVTRHHHTFLFFLSQRWCSWCSGSTVLKTSLGFHIKLNQPESVWQSVMLKASSVLPKQLELRLQDERNLWTVALEQSEAINTALEIWKDIYIYL